MDPDRSQGVKNLVGMGGFEHIVADVTETGITMQRFVAEIC
jgi:hypothetical protein